MKKILFIAYLFTLTGISAMAQNDQPGGKIQERCRDYIQNRLNLSRAEAERFTPVFMRYFHDFNQTRKENLGDKLVMQQRIIELRLRYREEFKQIMDDQRANKVYKYEDEFRQGVIEILKENRREGPAMRRNKAMLE